MLEKEKIGWSIMKIGVFAYNFKHWKTQMGLFNLYMNNLKPLPCD
jgi:hypothetical protein